MSIANNIGNKRPLQSTSLLLNSTSLFFSGEKVALFGKHRSDNYVVLSVLYANQST